MLKSSTLTSLAAPGVTPRPDSCSVAGRREFELDWSGIEANDVDGGRRGVSRGLAKPPVIVAGLVPKVGADRMVLLKRLAQSWCVTRLYVDWRQKSGALIS